MGCDIHIYVEKKVNGKWECIDDLKKDEDGFFEIKGEEIYHGRNYILFALLANVRNYSGVEPISEPKGLPVDLSDQVKEISDIWIGNSHSHSYLTLQELLNYDFETMIPDIGYILNETWEKFQETLKNGSPDYSLLYPCDDWITSDLGWMDRMWEQPAKTIDKQFYEKTIPRLKELGSPDEIRIVFWFDN